MCVGGHEGECGYFVGNGRQLTRASLFLAKTLLFNVKISRPAKSL